MNEYDRETQEMVRMYRTHQGLREIGDHFGKSHQAIAYRLHQAGVELRRRGGGRDWSKDPETLAMKELYDGDKTLSEVGAVFGKTGATVAHRFRMAGFERRPRGGHKPPAEYTVGMAFKLPPALFEKLCRLSEAHTRGNRSKFMRGLLEAVVENR